MWNKMTLSSPYVIPQHRSFLTRENNLMQSLSRSVCLLAFLGLIIHGPVAMASEPYLIVSNERTNDLTILSQDGDFLQSIETCGRPRGMHFSSSMRSFYVGCADDDLILEYSLPEFKVLKRFTNIWAPETFDLSPNGRFLYISNEEDSVASVLDVETGEIITEYETGEEPEGVQFTSDGRYVFVASEVANLVHVIDTESKSVIKDIIVDTRPRRFALNRDESELWVSAELSSVINIINISELKVVETVAFKPPGFRKEQVTPVDVLINRQGDKAYAALGRANHVAIIDVPTRKVLDYVLVGSRAWGLALSIDERRLFVANGLSDDLTIIDTQTDQAIRSVKTGEVPYGILVVN